MAKTFIDFMLEAQKDPAMLKEFLAAQDVGALHNLFAKRDYSVTNDDLEKLIKIKAGVLGSGLPGIVQY